VTFTAHYYAKQHVTTWLWCMLQIGEVIVSQTLCLAVVSHSV